MTYVLEVISDKDKRKIIENFSSDPVLSSELGSLNKHKCLPDSWAIDRACDSYLLKEPESVRPDSSECPYLFYYAGNTYRVLMEHMLSNNFCFAKKYRPKADIFDEVVNEIKKTFSVYGRWGDGELNELGEPEFKVTPNFKEGV